MTKALQPLAEALLDVARAAGAQAAEALVLSGTSVSVDVRAGALEKVDRSEATDLGLRVLIGQRQAIVSSSDTSRATMAAMAERAVAMAREAPEDPFAGLAESSQLAGDRDAAGLDLEDPAAEPAAADLTADALTAEAAALAVDGVSQVQSAGASWSRTEAFMMATNGFAGGMQRTGASLSCAAISGTGTEMEREYDADMRIFRADLRAADEIGRIAGERASGRAGARQPSTGTFPVLFDERIASSLIGHLLAAANGATVARGSGWLRDRLGEPVLPAALSVIEDPHLPRKTGSRRFDSEGLPTAKRAIVDEGVLTGWTLDLASARKLGMAPTGNGTRGLSGPPSPGNWNIELTQGAQTPAELMRDMGTGLWVTSLIGSTINANTGDYSRGASGYWIENGEPAFPVNECTIAGTLLDMLQRIVPANDARTYTSRVVPSLLIDGMTLAGS